MRLMRGEIVNSIKLSRTTDSLSTQRHPLTHWRVIGLGAHPYASRASNWVPYHHICTIGVPCGQYLPIRPPKQPIIEVR